MPQRPKDVSDIFATVPFALKAHESPHGRVTAVSMMKDEGPFVLEWVAHHLSLGFTDLVVYTNDCTDGTDDMLIRLEELGLAHHRRNDIPEGMRPQPSALNYAQAEPIVCNSDWVLVFDADEFLCIKHGDHSLDGMISSAKELGANGIVITWRIFGSGGVTQWSRRAVCEQYLYAAPPMWNKGWGVKTLFQFDPHYWKLGIHRPKIKNKHLESAFPHSIHWLNGSGRPMEEYFRFRGWRSIVRTVGYDWAQMNHYAIKSKDSYAIRKFRGNVNNKANKYNSEYWSLQDRNEVYDDAVLAHAPKREEIFNTLLTDPVLHRLHFAALERVETRLEEFRQTPEYGALIASLEEASKVPITQVEAKPPQPRDPEKIAALMSDVEKKLTAKGAGACATKPEMAGGGSGGGAVQQAAAAEIYTACGGHGVATDAPEPLLKSFRNHSVDVPADPRIFSATALQAIAEGKFERNHARRLPPLLTPSDRYLEVGAGIGFLAAHLADIYPEMAIFAHEENPRLAKAMARLWQENQRSHGAPSPRLLLTTPLFHPEDSRLQASGLALLLRQTRPSALYVNDPRLSGPMIAHALNAHHPRLLIIGPRTLAGACNGAKLGDHLPSHIPPEEQPLANALTFREEFPHDHP